MSPQQIGHLMSDAEHSLQVTRCPHGMKTMSISLSIHILHSFSLWSFCSFSSGSSSGRKELQTHRFIKTLLICSCCDSGTTFLVGSPCGEPLKQSSTRAQEPGPAWLSLFRISFFVLDSRASKNEWLFVCPYHFSLPKIHSDPNSENKQKHLWPGYKRRSPLCWIATTIHSSPIH